MSLIILTVEDNSDPDLVITLEREGTVINLVGAIAVELIINNAKTGACTNSGHLACSVINAAGGVISYPRTTTDFPSPGRYFGNARIRRPSDKTETLYNNVHFIVKEQALIS